MTTYSLKDPKFRGYVALAVLGLVVVALLWPVAVSRDARHLSAYGDGDEDLSRFRGELALVGAPVRNLAGSTHALADLEAPGKTLLIVVGTERRYDASEAQRVVDLLRAGGTVLLADETAFGSDVAREAGFAFSERRLLDTSNFRGDPKLVVTTASLGDRSFRVVLNSPASIVPLSGAGAHDVLARSSDAQYPAGSYLDVNSNGEIDIADQPGPFPLIVRTNVGAGTLVLVADTGLFMNGQLALSDYDNARFVSELARSLVPSDGLIVLDESRHAPDALGAPWENALRTVARLTGGGVAPFILLTLLAAGTLAAWLLTRQTEDWSHHHFDVSALQNAPATVRPDLARAQRMARHRISERFNISMEQVAAMTTEELRALTGDKLLSDAASGALRGDLSPVFRAYSSSKTLTPTTESTP